VAEASSFRTLREVVRSDPQITRHTAELLRRVFTVDRDDHAFINEIALRSDMGSLISANSP
jgi:hypothetical protein